MRPHGRSLCYFIPMPCFKSTGKSDSFEDYIRRRLLCLAAALAIALLSAYPARTDGGVDSAPDTGEYEYAGADEDILFTASSGGELVETSMADWLPAPWRARCRRTLRPRP